MPDSSASPQRAAAVTSEERTVRDLLGRARALRPELIARQAETEKRTYYAPETHEAFTEAGFYRILVPRRHGGLELGPGVFLRVVTELARGCPSTGWMYCLGAAHALIAASLFEERAQDEIFADGDFIAPLAIAVGGTAEPAAAGGWTVRGQWKYCSGSPYATHFLAHALVQASPEGPPAPMLFCLPRAGWRRLDDWGNQLGLNGSGSHTIVVEDAHVPAHLALPGTHVSQTSVADGTPGAALHGNADYAGGPLSFMNLEIAALAVGMAQGALDTYEQSLQERREPVPPGRPCTENADYQLWYGEAAGLIATADAALRGAVDQWSAICRSPESFTREQDLRLSCVCRHVIALCHKAVETFLFPTAGSSATGQGRRLERIWRDMSALHSHGGISVLLPTVAVREYARTRFGVR
ncbi:MAG TPA: acyl-CoA dehydrogenase family protein [Streptomyces sp.]|uniref:acyl-CoA dehydrogenase family protein n=1 Tax=Streptomyces sp. TaxID=1931 RepID=UPI002C59EFAA|nr:acyl-CoA dehydrogenase family protein [Streptomyces sp.]HWU11092.1 acyl-CoA dehydrogenase family protein [Streptomyces sp.]